MNMDYENLRDPWPTKFFFRLSQKSKKIFSLGSNVYCRLKFAGHFIWLLFTLSFHLRVWHQWWRILFLQFWISGVGYIWRHKLNCFNKSNDHKWFRSSFSKKYFHRNRRQSCQRNLGLIKTKLGFNFLLVHYFNIN